MFNILVEFRTNAGNILAHHIVEQEGFNVNVPALISLLSGIEWHAKHDETLFIEGLLTFYTFLAELGDPHDTYFELLHDGVVKTAGEIPELYEGILRWSEQVKEREWT